MCPSAGAYSPDLYVECDEWVCEGIRTRSVLGLVEVMLGCVVSESHE